MMRDALADPLDHEAHGLALHRREALDAQHARSFRRAPDPGDSASGVATASTAMAMLSKSSWSWSSAVS